jgi:hypothetical protein
MRLPLCLVVATLLLTGTAGAARSDYDLDPRLGRIARESLWRAALGTGLRMGEVRSVAARCYRTPRAFEDRFEDRTGDPARKVVAYYAGGRALHLRPTTCANVRLLLDGLATVRTAGAFSVLLHEALHRQGLRDERLTTCFADDAVRWGLVRLGRDEEAALRARDLAFDHTRLYVLPSYRMGRSRCLALTRRSTWLDHL